MFFLVVLVSESWWTYFVENSLSRYDNFVRAVLTRVFECSGERKPEFCSELKLLIWFGEL